jgi:glycosyltransferase involved in cell wall biosynthesis
MVVGIDASRAFQKSRTGIEEYSYQVIRHLREPLKNESVVLFCNPAVNGRPDPASSGADFELPEKWRIKNLRAPIFWTQIRLSLEMLFGRPDALFVPAHTVPFIHPANTIVTIHGLEYEFCPKAYSFFERLYMRWSIRKSCKWAKKIIAVSKNTKRDLMTLYGVPEEKIEVVYEGISPKARLFPSKSSALGIPQSQALSKFLLFVGRLEERKNIIGIIDAFEILKEKRNLPHKLVLAGKFGYGGESIKYKVESSKYKDDIVLPGYVSDEEKWQLLENADVFLFPTLYEGFGLPILEAQAAGTPVVTSNISSMPEIAGGGAILVDPKDPSAIAEATHKLVADESRKNDIIEKGRENVKRFSWEKCAEEMAQVLMVMNDKKE